MPAGEPDADGIYPEGTINRMVADRLADFAKKARKFGVPGRNDKNNDSDASGNNDKTA